MLKRAVYYFHHLSLLDFLRKLIYYFISCCSISRIIAIVKSYYYFKTTNVKLGRGIRIYGLPMLFSAGKNITIYDRCIFEFGSKSEVLWGDNFLMSYGSLFCCNHKIEIGKNVQFGEYCSIRDTTHSHKNLTKPMRFGEDISLPIFLGNDIWIGRGCIILPGTVIEDGVVVGANSVVKGILEKNGIYGGTPAKLIKYRL